MHECAKARILLFFLRSTNATPVLKTKRKGQSMYHVCKAKLQAKLFPGCFFVFFFNITFFFILILGNRNKAG